MSHHDTTTVAIIKPDAVKHVGPILSLAYAHNILPIQLRMDYSLSHEFWGEFYRQHEGKEFYPGLIEFMASGPCVVALLSGESVVQRWRELMGATDPRKAKHGTLRARYGGSMPANAVHGSDSYDAVQREANLLGFPL